MFPVPHMSRVDLSLSSVSLRGSTSISTDSTRLLPAAALHPLRRKKPLRRQSHPDVFICGRNVKTDFAAFHQNILGRPLGVMPIAFSCGLRVSESIAPVSI